MPRLLAPVLLLALALAVLPSACPAADDLEQRLEVVYLYNFTRYVDWPDASLGDAFVIAVAGDPGLAEALRVLEKPDKRAEGRPIRIRPIDDVRDADGAQILFVGKQALPNLTRILARTRGKPILLVGDSPGMAGRGVAIELFLEPDILGAGDQLRFRINPEAVEGRGLKVMADLYDVAEIVR